MTKIDKEKYAKLAVQSEEKQVPRDWVYVGKGKDSNLPFGPCLKCRGARADSLEWSRDNEMEGWSDVHEYACPVKIWEEKTGLLFESHDKKETSEKGKTTQEWLETLPSPYRELAVYNAIQQNVNKDITPHVCGALHKISWNDTEQGQDFYRQIYYGHNNPNFIWPQIPDKTKEKTLKGLCGYDIVMDKKKNEVRVGCQIISCENALKIAAEFNSFFGPTS